MGYKPLNSSCQLASNILYIYYIYLADFHEAIKLELRDANSLSIFLVFNSIASQFKRDSKLQGMRWLCTLPHLPFIASAVVVKKCCLLLRAPSAQCWVSVRGCVPCGVCVCVSVCVWALVFAQLIKLKWKCALGRVTAKRIKAAIWFICDKCVWAAVAALGWALLCWLSTAVSC